MKNKNIKIKIKQEYISICLSNHLIGGLGGQEHRGQDFTNK